jgi:hypothetical protein
MFPKTCQHCGAPIEGVAYRLHIERWYCNEKIKADCISKVLCKRCAESAVRREVIDYV